MSVPAAETAQPTRRERYEAYLQGDHWRWLKGSIYAKRGHRCEVCRRSPEETGKPSHGHHLTYRDPLESCTADDIMILCERCHSELHKRPALNDLAYRQEQPSGEKREQILSTLWRSTAARPDKPRKKRATKEPSLKFMSKSERRKARRLRKLRKRLARMQPMREQRRRQRWFSVTGSDGTPTPCSTTRPKPMRSTGIINVSAPKYEYGADGKMYRSGWTPAHLRLPMHLRYSPPET